MALEEIRQLTRGWLLELANTVWPEEQVDHLEQQADRLKEAIREGYDALLRRRRALERVHAEISEQEQKAVTLPWQVDSFLQVGNKKAAWRVALQLEEVRAALAANRVRMAKLEREQRCLVAELEEHRRVLGQMQMQVLRMRRGSLAASGA